MIINDKLDRALNQGLLRKICCPICLSTLFHTCSSDEMDHLSCRSCNSTFIVDDRLPVLLIDDENWRKKKDEIDGEVVYNKKVIPPEVHEERNAFVDHNTAMFLSDSRTNLSNDDVLIVGCSFAELEFFHKQCRRVVSLDIVPSLVKDCLNATRHRKIPAEWVCGDGEYLPFEDETFDSVIVRQTLHHMLKYYSAICEFFRVCKRGGNVLLIDEPYSPASRDDLTFLQIPDHFPVYDKLEFKNIRKELNLPRSSSSDPTPKVDFKQLEVTSSYIEPDTANPESFLADKYLSFSLLNCIHALRLHTDDFKLFWPLETAWTDESSGFVRFCHGPDPNYKKPLIKKLTSQGNVSVAARKSARTTIFRDRSSLRALPVHMAVEMTR